MRGITDITNSEIQWRVPSLTNTVACVSMLTCITWQCCPASPAGLQLHFKLPVHHVLPYVCLSCHHETVSLSWACSTGSTLNFSTFASMSLSMTLALALHYYSEFEMNVKSLHHSASCSSCCCWPLHPKLNQRHASCLAIDQDCQIILKFNGVCPHWQTLWHV